MCSDGQENLEGAPSAILSQRPDANVAVPPGGAVATEIVKWDLELRCQRFIGPLAGGRKTSTVHQVFEEQAALSSHWRLLLLLHLLDLLLDTWQTFRMCLGRQQQQTALLPLCPRTKSCSLLINFPATRTTATCGQNPVNVSTWVSSHLFVFDWISHPG